MPFGRDEKPNLSYNGLQEGPTRRSSLRSSQRRCCQTSYRNDPTASNYIPNSLLDCPEHNFRNCTKDEGAVSPKFMRPVKQYNREEDEADTTDYNSITTGQSIGACSEQNTENLEGGRNRKIEKAELSLETKSEHLNNEITEKFELNAQRSSKQVLPLSRGWPSNDSSASNYILESLLDCPKHSFRNCFKQEEEAVSPKFMRPAKQYIRGEDEGNVTDYNSITTAQSTDHPNSVSTEEISDGDRKTENEADNGQMKSKKLYEKTGEKDEPNAQRCWGYCCGCMAPLSGSTSDKYEVIPSESSKWRFNIYKEEDNYQIYLSMDNALIFLVILVFIMGIIAAGFQIGNQCFLKCHEESLETLDERH